MGKRIEKLQTIQENSGWICLHRKLLNSPVYTTGDPYLLQLWIYILLKVNHQDKRFLFNGKEVIVKKGSGIFGLNQIVRDLAGLKSENTKNFKKMKTIYYRKLKILENIGNLKLYPTNKYTLITVKNWGRYQENETQLKLKRNSTETQLKTNNNDNNVNNISKDMGVAPEFGNSDINKFIKGVNKYLEIKLPDDGKARMVAKNALELFTKRNSKGDIKYGREFLKEDKWENVKDFLAYYLEEKVDKGYSAQSWFRLYDNVKLWIANEGRVPSK